MHGEGHGEGPLLTLLVAALTGPDAFGGDTSLTRICDWLAEALLAKTVDQNRVEV